MMMGAATQARPHAASPRSVATPLARTSRKHCLRAAGCVIVAVVRAGSIPFSLSGSRVPSGENASSAFPIPVA